MNTKEFVLALSKVKRWGLTKVANYVIKHGYDFEECLNFLELELDSNELRSFNDNLLIAQEEIKTNENKNIKLLTLFDNNFPKKLCECSEPVIYLFYVGDISLLSSKCLTIVGTRNPTEPFISLGEKVTKYYASKGITIVSGLALGCDTIAHRATLDVKGKTIAVLPSALDKIVPTQNKELARDIVRNGGLVISEYSVTSIMNKFNYPQRDRIQSLISNISIIIQSKNDGGTMIAAKKSLKDGKNVFAIKGNQLEVVNNYLDPKDLEQLNKVHELI